MTSPLILLRHGAAGLPRPVPVEFATLILPASPNTCLAGPPEYRGPKHVTVPPFAERPVALWQRLGTMAAAQPRTWKLADWPERRQGQWVERSALMNYPDIIAAEVQPHPQGSALLIYSRSLLGWSDLGANARRVAAWLAALRNA